MSGNVLTLPTRHGILSYMETTETFTEWRKRAAAEMQASQAAAAAKRKAEREARSAARQAAAEERAANRTAAQVAMDEQEAEFCRREAERGEFR